MSGFERAGRTAADRAGTGTTNAAGTPGKRTLTESLNAREVTAAESLAGGGSTEGGPLEKAGGAGAAVNIPVQTTIPGNSRGAAAETREGASAHAPAMGPPAAELTANSVVAPGGAPTVGAGANDCIPSTASAVVA
jgi:hypothetical protein